MIENEMLAALKAVVSWWNASPSRLEPLAIAKARAAIETGDKDDMLAALESVVSWYGAHPHPDSPAIAKAKAALAKAR
jgi:hypothetical protein